MCFLPVDKSFLIYWSWLWLIPFIWTGFWLRWQVDRGCLLLGTWSHIWYIQRSVFAPFSNFYFLQDLWDWWLFVIYAISYTGTSHGVNEPQLIGGQGSNWTYENTVHLITWEPFVWQIPNFIHHYIYMVFYMYILRSGWRVLINVKARSKWT
jgi:hypothetical protein